MTMYNSLKSWINLPIKHKRFTGVDGAGDISYAPAEDLYCYIEGKVTLVRSNSGDEVTTSRKVYVDGATAKNFWPYRESAPTEAPVAADLLIIDNMELPVIATAPFYRDGKIDIMVVYV